MYACFLLHAVMGNSGGTGGGGGVDGGGGGGGGGGGMGGGGGAGGGGSKVWGTSRDRMAQMTFIPRVERSGANGGLWEDNDAPWERGSR